MGSTRESEPCFTWGFRVCGSEYFLESIAKSNGAVCISRPGTGKLRWGIHANLQQHLARETERIGGFNIEASIEP